MSKLLATLFAIGVLLTLPPASPDVALSATWQRSHVARVAWVQPAGVALTCLYRNPIGASSTLIGCWQQLPAGDVALTLPGSKVHDAAYVPASNDVYQLWIDGASVYAPLRAVLSLPVFYH